MQHKPNVAKSIDKRVSRHIASVMRLRKLLEESQANPSSASVKLLAACATQHGLAAYSSASQGITHMSLNTLKLACNLAWPTNGWNEVNSLRKRLILQGGKQERSGRGVPKQKNQNHNHNLQIIDKGLRARAILYRAYLDLLSIARLGAKTDAKLSLRLDLHIQTFEASFGLNLVEEKVD